MIKGLDKFSAHFATDDGAFVLIGGVACHEWFASQGLDFRATRDIDIVLIVEAIDQAFVARFWKFVEAGKYAIRERATGSRELYRFSKPGDNSYPVMLELFSRKPKNVDLGEGQHVVPLVIEENAASLSAILLDDNYYNLIREQQIISGKVPIVTPAALIPLKARAWLDLTERQEKGGKVDARDIAKHRADIFRIGAALSGEPGPGLPGSIQEDLKMFLAAFPADSAEWNSIRASLQSTFPNVRLKPGDLIEAIRTYFKLA